MEFNFQDQGLTLIQGPTGSGKSTLMDAIPWVLFGHTAKGGKVDEIRSWNYSNLLTAGIITIDTNGDGVDSIISISRSRNPNDLVFRNSLGQEIRGKDLNDTQKSINQKLGIDCDLYLSGAYFHEFSQTASFFTTTAKNRRHVCEQIVDLSLAKNLQDKVKEENKSSRLMVSAIQNDIRVIQSNIELLKQLEVSENTKAATWQESNDRTITYLTTISEKFEKSRKQIFSNKCKECGTVLAKPRTIINNDINPYLTKIEDAKAAANPYTDGVADFSKDIKNKEKDVNRLNKELRFHRLREADFNSLEDVLNEFRGELVKNTIQFVENNTNKLLTEYFDAEINVRFNIEESDKLEVEIQKDGNVCSFTQLSKGQRQLLKLTFGVSIMQAVQNQHGVKFEQIFIDEGLEGLDENMKTKAYRLLENLSQPYNSVFVVEHSPALKNMFSNAYEVTLENGNSQICQV